MFLFVTCSVYRYRQEPDPSIFRDTRYQYKVRVKGHIKLRCIRQSVQPRITSLTSSEKPTVFVLAGANGAGKTDFAKAYLPHFAGCREFVNADLIAADLSSFDRESQSIEAGRWMLQ